MASLPQVRMQRSLSVDVTFHETVDGYWSFAYQLPIHAFGATFQQCVEALCADLTHLVIEGERAANRAVLATADAIITVENPYTAPVCAVALLNPRWPRRRRQSPLARVERA